MILTHVVTRKEEGMTLHQLMRGPLALSARQTKNAKAQGAVTVDAAPFFSNQSVHEGMVVRIELDGYSADMQQNAQTALPSVQVLYEDDALIAVHKPALLQCHPSSSMPNGSDTLEARVQQHLGYPAHPVHRLDAETTGIVLFAKLPFAQAHLQQQMQAGTFHKTYQAWVLGIPSPAEGEIDAPIARQTPDSFTRVVREDGQRAVSRYKNLYSIPLPSGMEASLMELSPVTGRTHQLRVHMTHIGCPLLGDARYFTEESKAASASLDLTYHQLAAVSLSFIHPASGETVSIACPAQFAFSPDVFL